MKSPEISSSVPDDIRAAYNKQTLPPAEIKRLKGLGCLQDKRFDDVFNVRVITRNGKITAAEQIAIAEAARKYGSGEITMATRLTLEIQGVPYARLDEIFDFLGRAGLATGGRWGKKIAIGKPINRIFESEAELIELVEKTILLFRDEGQSGERFADTIARLGFDYVENKLLHSSIDKDQIMQKSVTGGASC